MSKSITGTFDTRRDAELAVERLVQEFGIERTDIFVTTQGDDNSAGIEVDGSDAPSGAPGDRTRQDGALEGAVTVSVDANDDAAASNISAAFEEFGGTAEVEG